MEGFCHFCKMGRFERGTFVAYRRYFAGSNYKTHCGEAVMSTFYGACFVACRCLEESLRLSPELLFKVTETEWGGWQQRQQHLANQLRVKCGIECKEMGLPFGGLSQVRLF